VDFLDRLEQVRAANDVLEHPFYVRWSAGELRPDELALYAGEYRHAVIAIAKASNAAARKAGPDDAPELEAHAAEEAEHVALWDDFARAVGADTDAEPQPETEACAAAWAGHKDRSLLHDFVALYAIESGQPAISETKRRGLREHYGIEETAYFDVHVVRDVEHAAAGRALIARHLDGADEAELLGHAEAVLRANWLLLDGVQGSTSPLRIA
jgi:pyrroloquinoline-quinone synthase